MKKQLLNQIIKKKQKKTEFSIITNLENGEGCIFEKNKPIDKNFEKYIEKINFLIDISILYKFLDFHHQKTHCQ